MLWLYMKWDTLNKGTSSQSLIDTRVCVCVCGGVMGVSEGVLESRLWVVSQKTTLLAWLKLHEAMHARKWWRHLSPPTNYARSQCCDNFWSLLHLENEKKWKELSYTYDCRLSTILEMEARKRRRETNKQTITNLNKIYLKYISLSKYTWKHLFIKQK